MINFIGIIILIIIEALLMFSVITYFIHKSNISDNEIAERDRELGLRSRQIKTCKLIIEERDRQIKELEYEIKQLKRECNKRL